jgi:flagellar biosynthesis protein FlhG
MDQGHYSDKVIAITEKRIAQIAGKNHDKLPRTKRRIPIIGVHGSGIDVEKRGTQSNVIGLARNNRVDDGKDSNKRGKRQSRKMRVVAITSGKGGVGKTNVVANLGYTLSQMGARVLILDADLGLGNLDILLGITPKYNLSHVIAGEKAISDIAVEAPGNMYILPAASGIEDVTHLTSDQRSRLLGELQQFTDTIDVLLIDTAAGISSNVMCFNTAAEEVLVVVSPEPTSITDAYALMKVLSLRYGTKSFKLLVNLASDTDEASEVYRQIQLVTDRFLDISIDYLGYVLFDKNVPRCVRRQKIVSDIFPATDSSQCFSALARKLFNSPSGTAPEGGTDGFWKNLFGTNGDESA